MLNVLKNKHGDLVFNFKLANYRSMNESQTRLSYIDKFRVRLGWQVSNPEEVRVESNNINRKFARKHIYRYITRIGREIDTLVYQLYELTEDEIKIVEGKE